jgi:hypothetical protein
VLELPSTLATTKISGNNMKTHIYKGNKIVEYANNNFIAYYFADGDVDGDIQSKFFESLELAQKYLDDNNYSVE